MEARIFGIKIVGAHNETPIIASMMPNTGKKGMIGQRIIKIKLTIPPNMIIMVPVNNKTKREKNPTTRETRRSINM